MKTTDSAQQSGYDAGKHVRGIKRHLAVDSEGLPHAIEVTTADVNDRNGALLMFLLHQDSLSEVACILVDGAYNGARFETENELPAPERLSAFITDLVHLKAFLSNFFFLSQV